MTPFVPPVSDSGSGFDTGGESADDGTGAESDADSSGGEDASGGMAAASDDLVYIFRREDEYGDARANNREETGETQDVVAELVSMEGKAIESYFAAAAIELAREMELLLLAVRSDHERLEHSLNSLREEYLLREPSEWTPLRNFLREMFETGNREKNSVNRVIGEMNRQIQEFKNPAEDKRDGMLTESLRELMDSASRRSGETGALAKALDALADLLRDSRQRGASVPSEYDMAALFDKTFETARNEWHSREVRNDPMGKELAAFKD